MFIYIYNTFVLFRIVKYLIVVFYFLFHAFSYYIFNQTWIHQTHTSQTTCILIRIYYNSIILIEIIFLSYYDRNI